MERPWRDMSVTQIAAQLTLTDDEVNNMSVMCPICYATKPLLCRDRLDAAPWWVDRAPHPERVAMAVRWRAERLCEGDQQRAKFEMRAFLARNPGLFNLPGRTST